MCGRFVGFRNVEQLKQYFPIDVVKCETVANYNVAPAQQILAVARHDGVNMLDSYHWGLVPFWAKDTKIGNNLINARSETVAIKPSFREAFKKRRCLILADGFYEWKVWKGEKQPVFITLLDKSPFAFAGLWEIWHDKQNQDLVYRSCTILTRDAVGIMKKIHHRMPAILPPEIYGEWLSHENSDLNALNSILQDNVVSDLVYHPVAKQVNSAKNNDPSNVKPVQIEFDF